MIVPGIYVLHGPNGVYVGESSDCFSRRVVFSALGLDWGIARELPDSTMALRQRVESEVADAWASRGWAVVSRNTTAHREWTCAALRQATLNPCPALLAARSRNGKRSAAGWSHEQRVAMGKRGVKGLTREQRADGARASTASLSPEQRSERTRAGWTTRRLKEAA